MPGEFDELYYHDKAEWEPTQPGDWWKRDPLLSAFREAEIVSRVSDQAFVSFHTAWTRMPPAFRSQIWREREIAAMLVRQLPRWRQMIPGLYSVGVGRWSNHATLVAIVTVEQQLTPGEWSQIRSGWKESSGAQSILPPMGFSPDVELVLDRRPAPGLLGNVPPNSFLFGDPDPAPPSAPVLQSGDRIGSESPVGIREHGTLTCVVSDAGSVVPLALCSGHVLLQPQFDFICGLPANTKVGKVRTVDLTLDAALAELSPPYVCDYRARAAGMVPAAPILPTTDMPVQMHGAQSGYQAGYLNQVNIVPAGAKQAGLIPMFTADIKCAHGDSGALLVTGRGGTPPVPQWQAKHMAQAYLDSLTCAMIGMLKAGPEAGSDPIVRPQGYFTPLLQVFDELNVEPWLRS